MKWKYEDGMELPASWQDVDIVHYPAGWWTKYYNINSCLSHCTQWVMTMHRADVSIHQSIDCLETWAVCWRVPQVSDVNVASVTDQSEEGDQTKLVVGVVVGLLIATLVIGLAYWVYMKKSK